MSSLNIMLRVKRLDEDSGLDSGSDLIEAIGDGVVDGDSRVLVNSTSTNSLTVRIDSGSSGSSDSGIGTTGDYYCGYSVLDNIVVGDMLPVVIYKLAACIKLVKRLRYHMIQHKERHTKQVHLSISTSVTNMLVVRHDCCNLILAHLRPRVVLRC